MLNPLLLTLYSLLFIFITWNRFSWGLYIFFFLLPTYLIRFSIGPFPTTLLEMMILIILIVALLKTDTRHKIQTNLKSQISKNYLLFLGISLFLLASTISIFTSTNTLSALGEWKAFYLEPISLFIILITNYKSLVIENKNFIKNIIFALVLSGLITSILATYQHFTGWMVPWDFWQNGESFRVTGWWGFPNGVGLFLSPLVLLSLLLIDERNWKTWVTPIIFIPLGILSVIFAKSTGGLIGIIGGFGLLLLFCRKTRWWTIGIATIAVISLFTFPQLSKIKEEIFFQDRSGQIRLSIWSETSELLKDNPIIGTGLASYQDKIERYHTTVNGEGIEIFHHPHNIFLTMWVNLGIFGLVGFLIILISLFHIPYSLFKKQGNIPISQYFIIASLTTILITGLVDSPYIKNDLSILFWLFPSLLLITTYDDQLENPKT